MTTSFTSIEARGRAWVLLVACCGAITALSAAADPQRTRWAGVVTYVADGDTVRVRPAHGGKPVSVRVDGIDAPEICQHGGEASRDALKQRVLGRQVVVDGRSRDDYGRLLGKVLLDGVDIGERQVTEGHAWSYRYRGRGGPYASQQRLAQSARRGIFADPTAPAVYPRVFRKQHGACSR